MSEFLNHPDFFNKPVLLSEAQQKAPLIVLREFFDDYHLSELRQIQDEVQEVCLTTGRPSFAEPEKRADFLTYQRNLLTLVEAAFVLAMAKAVY